MDKWLDELETCLVQLDREHDQLLGLVRRKQQAIRMARTGLMTDCTERENQSVNAIAEIEKRRQQVVGEITAAFAPDAAEPLTLTQIAERAGEPRQGRLLVIQQRLAQTMKLIRQENDISRRAVEGLHRHVQGVIRQVSMAMAGGTYGRRGVVTNNVSSFSVTG